MLLHSLSRLGYRPASDARELWMQPWLRGALARLKPRLESANAADLAMLATSLAAFNYTPPWAWLQPFLRACRDRAGDFSAPELAAVASGVARLQHPVPDWWAAALAAAVEDKLHDFDGQELARVRAPRKSTVIDGSGCLACEPCSDRALHSQMCTVASDGLQQIVYPGARAFHSRRFTSRWRTSAMSPAPALQSSGTGCSKRRPVSNGAVPPGSAWLRCARK